MLAGRDCADASSAGGTRPQRQTCVDAARRPGRGARAPPGGRLPAGSGERARHSSSPSRPTRSTRSWSPAATPILVGALWSPIPADECERGWKLLHGPICLPVEACPAIRARSRRASARDVAAASPARRRRTSRRRRRHGPISKLASSAPDFDELRASLEQALTAGGQFVTRGSPTDDPDDGDDLALRRRPRRADRGGRSVLRPGPRAVLGPPGEGPDAPLRLQDRGRVADRRGEAERCAGSSTTAASRRSRPCPAPTNVAATARIGAAHLTADGVLNPFEMDVTVNWRRPSVCELTDPVRSPIAYLVERTAVDAPAAGPYDLISRRRFEPGGRARGRAGDHRRPRRGRTAVRERLSSSIVARATGRSTTASSAATCSAGRAARRRPGSVLVTDQVAPGPPLNLAAEYADPADPDRAGGALLAWANRDVPAGVDGPARGRPSGGSGPRAGSSSSPTSTSSGCTTGPGRLNHVLGRIETVTEVAPGEYEVTTDIARSARTSRSRRPASISVHCGAKARSATILTLADGRRHASSSASGPTPLRHRWSGPATFRLGRGTSATASATGPRAVSGLPNASSRPADWEGFLVDPTAPPRATSCRRRRRRRERRCPPG